MLSSSSVKFIVYYLHYKITFLKLTKVSKGGLFQCKQEDGNEKV